jgi:putative transposase
VLLLKNDQAAMLNTKGMRFAADVILVCMRWCVAYPLSYRLLEEMMEERGVVVDHPSINRRAVRFLPLLEKACRKHEHAIGTSWRMDETYIRVNGAWKYLYRAVDKQGQTVDFLLTAKRDAAAARRFFEKPIQHNAVPDKATMGKSGANQAAPEQLNKGREMPITIRQVKYLKNIVKQDHRTIKRITRPVLGFKSCRAARTILAGIELMHMIRKGRFMLKREGMSFADQFYALAGRLRLA